MKISVVINTYNEEKNLERCLTSVKDFADEIVVVDMHSTDRTVEIARKFKAKIYQHNYTRFVEPARNFALQKATGDYLLILDADEELSGSLAEKLKEVIGKNEVDFVEIPRKNLIFGKWIQNSRWWPDYLIRFFKKGQVKFLAKIHEPPETLGQGIKLEAKETNALTHYHYQSVSQYLERVNRYTDIQVEELIEQDINFNWKDVIFKPINEFFSRYFAGQGYRDGFHGLALALLQAFSELVLYLKLWEKADFPEEEIKDLPAVSLKAIEDYLYWLRKVTPDFLTKLRLKIKAKL